MNDGALGLNVLPPGTLPGGYILENNPCCICNGLLLGLFNTTVHCSADARRDCLGQRRCEWNYKREKLETK